MKVAIELVPKPISDVINTLAKTEDFVYFFFELAPFFRLTLSWNRSIQRKRKRKTTSAMLLVLNPGNRIIEF